MQLYNTLSRSVEEVVPLAGAKSKSLGFYACGPTVYDFTHLGHLRKYVMDDILVRVLRDQGFEVQFVRNITDVGHLASDGDTGEDKLEKGAKKYHKTVWEVAHEFEDYFRKSMRLMNNLDPEVSCRATDHIPQQLAMVLALEKKGFTYVIEGDGVYFDTSKFPEYGQMAHLNLEKQIAGARLELLEGKRNPTDFALWKFERPGENRAMVWESPWAKRSFPGWHIECSAMACHYLGEQFDIHTGGIDHIPVHHTNEIAQAEAAFGKKPFVKYWVHHNFLQVEGEKMSKSLGNFFTIDDVIERGFNPMALRLLLLTTHYRSEMNFTWDNLAGTQKAYDKLVSMMQSLPTASLPEKWGEVAKGYWSRFQQALAQDLNTPEAVAILWSISKASDISDAERHGLLLKISDLLGLNLQAAVETTSARQSEDLPPVVQHLVDQRAQARINKDWKQADSFRDQLQAQGYSVEDTAEGQVVTKVSS